MAQSESETDERSSVGLFKSTKQRLADRGSKGDSYDDIVVELLDTVEEYEQ